MAQTGYTPILIYSSSTASQAPVAGNLTNSTLGSELAINITDGKLFYKDNANAVQVIGWKTVPTTAGGTGLTSYTAGDMLYYASGTTLTKLAIGASGRWLGSSGTAPQWNAPAALTKTDDTNVTLTLGGSASTALLNAASLTLGWSGQLAISRGGTNASSFTGLSGNVAGLVYFDGTKLTNNATVTNLGFDTSTNTFQTPNAALTGLFRLTGSAMSSASNGAVLEGAWPWLLYRDTESAQSSFVNYIDGGFWYVASIPYADRNSAPSGVATTRFQVRDDGNVTVNTGNLVIGTSGKGIDFSANSHAAGMTSELLTWYEEGTFTPTIVGTTSAGTGTYSAQTGRYTRTGDRVYINLYLSWSAHTGTGNMRIDGLPFTSANVANTYSALSPYISNLTLTAGYWLQPYIGPNRTFISLEQVQASAASIAVPMDTSAEIIISGFYEV